MLYVLVYVLSSLVSIYAAVMLLYCLFTWFIRDPSNKFIRMLAAVAEPPLMPIRNFLNRFYYFQNSPVDFSPLILFFLLRLLVSLISRLAFYFR